MSIYELIAERLAEGLEPEEVADTVCADAEVAALVWPLVVNAARSMMRAETRGIEAELEVPKRNALRGVAWATQARKLQSERMWVPGYGYVMWLDASAEQHRARAAYLRSQASSTIRTAELHEKVARDLEAAQAASLRVLAASAGAA